MSRLWFTWNPQNEKTNFNVIGMDSSGIVRLIPAKIQFFFRLYIRFWFDIRLFSGSVFVAPLLCLIAAAAAAATHFFPSSLFSFFQFRVDILFIHLFMSFCIRLSSFKLLFSYLAWMTLLLLLLLLLLFGAFVCDLHFVSFCCAIVVVVCMSYFQSWGTMMCFGPAWKFTVFWIYVNSWFDIRNPFSMDNFLSAASRQISFFISVSD